VFISLIGFSALVGINENGSIDTQLLIYFMITAIIAILLSVPLLYLLGRYGGRKLLFWLFDKEKLEKNLEWFANNGSKGVPWLFLIPFFPTDLLCVVCGAAKMRFWQFILIAVVFRPLEALLLIGYRIVGEEALSRLSTIELLLIINVIIIDIILLVIYHKALLGWFNRTFTRRRYQDDLAVARKVVMAALSDGKLNGDGGYEEKKDEEAKE
jgi:membrane protein DedA with SNARE-associated domain